MEHLSYVTKDKDAKFGSKGPGKSFYGYKANIGMTPESIIVAATVTSGEVGDGEYLVPLVEQAKRNGLEVESAIAEAAYASKENLEALKGDIQVIAPVNQLSMAIKMRRCYISLMLRNAKNVPFVKAVTMGLNPNRIL